MSDEFVLMYHSVATYAADPYLVTVRPDRFRQQMRWLRRNGLRGVSMRDLMRARATGAAGRLVGLTFDDGYADFTTHVMPVLARFGFTATVFVVAGTPGGYNTWDQPGPTKALMTADEMRQAADAGMEVASHGLLHRSLPDVDEATLAREVDGSRDAVARLVGREVDGFCYPYGNAGPREVEAVRAAGYSYACAVRPSVFDSRLAIPRTYVGDRDGAARLYAKRLRHRVRTVRGAR